MKDNLRLKAFPQQPVNGTFNLKEERSFFGAKMMEIEDEIDIDKASIQYYNYWVDTSLYNQPQALEDAKNNGFQFYTLNTQLEALFIQDLVFLKSKTHTIRKFQQNAIDLKNNTRWELNIDVRTMLQNYLIYRIKEARTFRGLKYDNFLNKNIDQSVLEYINLNLLDRYKFEALDLYIFYQRINKDNSIYNFRSLLQYDPVFDSSVEIPANKVSNANVQQGDVVDQLSNVTLIYNQTKPSTEWKFDYYFNVKYKKI